MINLTASYSGRQIGHQMSDDAEEFAEFLAEMASGTRADVISETGEYFTQVERASVAAFLRSLLLSVETA